MRLTSFLRSGVTLILLALNFVFPFLVELAAPRAGGEVYGLTAVSHYAQMSVLALVWLLTPAGGLTALYVSLTAVSVLAVGLMGETTVFSVSAGWCLTAMVAADSASRLTRRARDRRAAAQAASLMMDELQRDRSLAILKLLIGLAVLLDSLMVIIYCLRPVFAEGLNIVPMPAAAAAGLTAFPVLLMTAGGRRPELTCLAGLAALAGLWADLWLMFRLWGMHWADFLRTLDSLALHLQLSRLLGQAGAAAALWLIIVSRIRELGRQNGTRPRLQRIPPFRPLRILAVIVVLAVGLAAVLLGAAEYFRSESDRRPPWAGLMADRGLGRVRLSIPVDLNVARDGLVARRLEHGELRLTEHCGPTTGRPFPPILPAPTEFASLEARRRSRPSLPMDFSRPPETDSQPPADFPPIPEVDVNRTPPPPNRRELLTLLEADLTWELLRSNLAELSGYPFGLDDTSPLPDFDPPARLMVQAESFRNGQGDHRRLTLNLMVTRDDGRLEVTEEDELTVKAEPDQEEIPGRAILNFLREAGRLLADYRWTGAGPGPEPGFITLCGTVPNIEKNLSGRVSYTDGRRAVLTLGYGEWYDDSAPFFPVLRREAESLYATGRRRDSYRLKTAADRPGLVQITRNPYPEAEPGRSRLTLTWRPDDASEFPVILRLDALIDDRDPEDYAQTLARWEAIVDSLRPAEQAGTKTGR